MRWPKIGLFLLSLLPLSAIPPSAEALQVQFCVPDCLTATVENNVTVGETAAALPDLNKVYTTTLPLTLPRGNVGGFTVTGTAPKVVAQQSGTLQKITFSTATIVAPSGCTVIAPCSIEIVATSDPNDFPTPKPAGGYPAGTFLAGYFLGPQSSTAGEGDTISMTAEAGGLGGTVEAPTVLNNDVVNATPGAGSGDTRVSLPSSCAGKDTCKFTATSSIKSLNTQITETVQQKCDGTATSCLTRLKTTLKISFKTAGNSFTLPAGLVTVDPPEPGQAINPIALLIAETLPPFGNLDVTNLAVASSAFALTAKITLDPGNRINPAGEEVYLRVGPFAMTIPAGKFRQQGNFFTFFGKVNALDVAAVFQRDSKNPANWSFGAGVSGVRLTGLPHPQVPVDIAVGNDKGSDLVTPRFF